MPQEGYSRTAEEEMTLLTKYSPPFGYYNYAYYLRHPVTYLKHVRDHVVRIYQRGTRGYSDYDAWDVMGYLCQILPPLLRTMAANLHGLASSRCDRCNQQITLSEEEWKATILYLAETFEIRRKLDGWEYDHGDTEAQEKRFQHGMRMFAEYFTDLWD